MPYIVLPITVERAELAEAGYDVLRAAYPGWEPADGHVEAIVIDATAEIGADVAYAVSAVGPEIFRYFGRSMVGLTPTDAAPATGSTTWTASSDTGRTIPDGTQLAGTNPDGDLVAFRVVGDWAITAGVSSLVGVPVEALTEGTEGNSITGPADLIDALEGIDSVVFDGATSGGTDREADEAYNDRLSDELVLMAPRPILAEDFATMARTRVAGVYRAAARDGLDPSDGSTDNARTVAVAAVDEDGNAVSGATKTEIEALLEGLREVNFQVFVTDPTYTAVSVTFTATAWPGWDAAAVQTAAVEAVTDYLSPARWGQPPYGETREWVHEPSVRYLEVAEALQRVEGVRWITALAVNGGTADVALAGYFPLPQPGTITGTVNAG